MAGHILMEAAAQNNAEIIPVDSEHSAIFQALQGENTERIRRIILTASGGPFVDLPSEEFRYIMPQDALKHPTWSMGKKITIDSATMMNKALEIVEARWLFNLPADKISVVVHRQSIVHSMVEFVDGSVIAQMGTPDMKLPIRLAFTYPDRFPLNRSYFDLDRCARLTFEEPEEKKFPALSLGFKAARAEGLAGTVLNAANESAVDLFLKGTISFDDITRGVIAVMNGMNNRDNPSLEEILAADRWAREETNKWFSQ
jgi:1-deoxy-D-xylulose-5-phosphate reductoisomerase